MALKTQTNQIHWKDTFNRKFLSNMPQEKSNQTQNNYRRSDNRSEPANSTLALFFFGQRAISLLIRLSSVVFSINNNSIARFTSP